MCFNIEILRFYESNKNSLFFLYICRHSFIHLFYVVAVVHFLYSLKSKTLIFCWIPSGDKRVNEWDDKRLWSHITFTNYTKIHSLYRNIDRIEILYIFTIFSCDGILTTYLETSQSYSHLKFVINSIRCAIFTS